MFLRIPNLLLSISILNCSNPTEPDSTRCYGDLQYIRNTFTGKAEVRETEVERETLTFRYREIDPGGSLILQDVAIMTGVVIIFD